MAMDNADLDVLFLSVVMVLWIPLLAKSVTTEETTMISLSELVRAQPLAV